MAVGPRILLAEREKPPLTYHQKREPKGDSKSEIFSQIFFHALNAAFHGAADGALVHALLTSDLPVGLAKDQVSVHPAALGFRQGVKGVPQPEEKLLAIQNFLGAGLMQAGRVFNAIVTVQGVIRLKGALRQVLCDWCILHKLHCRFPTHAKKNM